MPSRVSAALGDEEFGLDAAMETEEQALRVADEQFNGGVDLLLWRMLLGRYLETRIRMFHPATGSTIRFLFEIFRLC